MRNGMVMNGRHGMTMTGVRSGLVVLMIGLVTGLGPKMTGIAGPMTGLGVLRTGGVLSENDQLGRDDRLVEFHLQAGLVDKSWILFDSGACANCCPEWFAPDYPILPLNESAPSLRSLSGKTLDVQGRKIVQLDCGNGHSLSVQFYVCTGIPFPLVRSPDCCYRTFGQ